MSSPIIEVKNIAKSYKITHERGGYIALRDVITDAFKHPLRYLGSKFKDMTGLTKKEVFWALKDINFTVNPGEVVGIIGHNGAGKSTLLKILSQITSPTEGEITLHGKVGSLLEVGTGFHPELTGRENIFLNGAILGMTRKEMASKFDAIVRFAEIEKFLDTPVKYYSSGMYVRLAFSVAAHMEPDILIIDEVLAVGDADFQKKCLGKMDQITREDGRTILFVSHNMEAVRKLCNRCILIEKGVVKASGDTDEIISMYLKDPLVREKGVDVRMRHDRKGAGRVKIDSFFIEENGKKVNTLKTGGSYTLCFEYTTDGSPVNDVNATFSITAESGTPLILASTNLTKEQFATLPQKGVIRCSIDQKFPLNVGTYGVSVDLHAGENREDHVKNVAVFRVDEGDYYGTGVQTAHSPIFIDQKWSVVERK
ncbi:MAG: ABC transporter ATP-binding protein [Patescibacteria group bacterium]